jgi:hypothetical protein
MLRFLGVHLRIVKRHIAMRLSPVADVVRRLLVQRRCQARRILGRISVEAVNKRFDLRHTPHGIPQMCRRLEDRCRLDTEGEQSLSH